MTALNIATATSGVNAVNSLIVLIIATTSVQFDQPNNLLAVAMKSNQA